MGDRDQCQKMKEHIMLASPDQSLLTSKMPRQTPNHPSPFHPYSHMKIQTHTATCETSQNNSKCDEFSDSRIHLPDGQFEEPKNPCMPGYKDFYSLLLASCKTKTPKVEAEREENAGLELDLSKCSSLLRRSIMMACRVKIRETLLELGEIKDI